MDNIQRQAAVNYVENQYCNKQLIEVDANTVDSMINFAQHKEGVWVRAWLWCPKSAIEQYEYPKVTRVPVVQPLSFEAFSRRYKAILDSSCDAYSEQDVFSSWHRYQADPAGHFIHRYPEYDEEEEIARAQQTADKFGKDF